MRFVPASRNPIPAVHPPRHNGDQLKLSQRHRHPEIQWWDKEAGPASNMDSPRRPGSQEAELPRFAASLVGLVRSWQRQFGEVVQSWHLPANGQDNSACFQAPTISFQHRKRRRRRNGRFAALSFGLDGAAARNRQPSMAIDGLCLGAGINGAKDNATVSFPQPRRQDQERLLISEVRTVPCQLRPNGREGGGWSYIYLHFAFISCPFWVTAGVMGFL